VESIKHFLGPKQLVMCSANLVLQSYCGHLQFSTIVALLAGYSRQAYSRFFSCQVDDESGHPAASAQVAMQRIWQGLPPGSGILGLAVAQSQAQAVGGRLHIGAQQTAEPMEGTTISLWLPSAT
jgi:signal transduction histidine kinase